MRECISHTVVRQIFDSTSLSQLNLRDGWKGPSLQHLQHNASDDPARPVPPSGSEGTVTESKEPLTPYQRMRELLSSRTEGAGAREISALNGKIRINNGYSM
jgi:hypothetical protein